MTNQTFEGAKDSFMALLGPLTQGAEPVVAEVIFGRGTITAGFPSIRVTLFDFVSEHVSQRDYRRGLGFKLEVIQENSQKDPEQAEIDLGKAVWAIFDVLEENWDVSGSILDDPNGSTGETQEGDGKVIIASLLAKPRSFHQYL